MTKEQLWRIYADRNPAFDGTDLVTITPSGIKKLFEQTWDQAFEFGKAKQSSDSAGLSFDELFGKYKK